MTRIRLRPEVQRFADEMERRLRAHDNDRGESWRSTPDLELMARAEDELLEFTEVFKLEQHDGLAAQDLLHEAADTANFLMFIVEKRR